MSYPGIPPPGGWSGMPQQQGYGGPPSFFGGQGGYPPPPGSGYGGPPPPGPGYGGFGPGPGGYPAPPGGPGFPGGPSPSFAPPPGGPFMAPGGPGGYPPPGGSPYPPPASPYPPPGRGEGGGGESHSWNPRLGAAPSPYDGGSGYPPPSTPYPPNTIPPGQSGHPFGVAQQGIAHPPPSGPQMGQQWGNMQQGQQYQYSQCTGRKKALCIGINYIGTGSELRGCINDAKNMKRFLMERFGYHAEDIVMLLDDAVNQRQKPTRQNIIDAMRWLVADARPNDSLWFHYSGHGGQAKDLDGDEDDGYDETILPVDFEEAGQIIDDEIHDIMVRYLPIGCRLTAIFDSCHSGSVLDLPYMYSTEGKIKEPNQALEAGKGALDLFQSYRSNDMGGMFKAGMGLFKTATGAQKKAEMLTRETKGSPADVISWSGCKDSQTSADATEAGKATGAMSYAFIKALSDRPEQTYMQLLISIREILKSKYEQKPQLSASHPIDTDILFIA